MNVYTHLGLDYAKEEMIRMEELEQARKEVEKTEGSTVYVQSSLKNWKCSAYPSGMQSVFWF